MVCHTANTSIRAERIPVTFYTLPQHQAELHVEGPLWEEDMKHSHIHLDTDANKGCFKLRC